MGKHRDFDNEDLFYASWTDAIQEYLSTIAANFKLYSVDSKTIGLKDIGSGASQVAIGLGGPWRYRSTAYNLAISGAAGTQDIYAVAVTPNDFEGAGKDPDDTDYDFELRAVASGGTPSSVAYYRKVGEVDWSGSAITALRQTVNSTSGAMLESGALSGEGDLSWTQEPSGAWVPKVKDKVITSRNFKPVAGEVLKTGAATMDLTTAWVDIPGTERTFKPDVASLLMVDYWASLELFGEAGHDSVHIRLVLDGAGVTNSELGLILWELASPKGFNGILSVSKALALSAGEHKLKMQAKKEATPAARCQPPTGYTYLMVAS